MVNVTVNDQRTPVEPVVVPLSERVPLGAFVAYNGTTDDGQRRRAVVVGHPKKGEAVQLLDGSDKVTVEGDDVANIVILAKSADAFAQRVTRKAEALGRTHNWCGVARDAVRELNNTPEEVEASRSVMHVRLTVDAPFELLPTAYMNNHVGTDDETIQRYLRDTLTLDWRYLFNQDYFRVQNSVGDSAVVTLDIVDAPTSAIQEATTEA